MIKPGAVLRVFRARDGREVVLRALRWEDLDDMLDLINSLIEERAYILMEEKVGRREEAEWLGRALARMENGDAVYLVAEVGGRVVAGAELSRRSELPCWRHVAYIVVMVKRGYRRIGIGTELVKTLIDLARERGFKLIHFPVFERNVAARRLYSKLGFREVGRIPKGFYRDGEFMDEILMAMELPEPGDQA